ncbi:MAG: methionine adenosyltransferase domain-containing protein, partial [Muribaculaceae bacterium]|nr:methionine adenosyltransferase domain-containing protein [Muribaculaceae bacterium]
VQVAYAIGEASPVSFCVNTFGRAKVNMSDAQIADVVKVLFDMRPLAIEKRFGLREPIYSETAAYGHMGREPRKVKKTFKSGYDAEPIEREVELFSWEKLDSVPDIRKAFNFDV